MERVKVQISKSVEETLKAGERLAALLSPGDIVLLMGDMGAGKTHLVKGFARFFGIAAEQVQSPTFSLVHEYPGKFPLYHIDAYRIRDFREAREAGFEEYLNGEGIVFVEWPEKIEELLPPGCIKVELRHKGSTMREIRVHPDR